MDQNKEIRNAQRPGDYRLLAQQASVEIDPEKLMNLVLELNGVFEEQHSNYYSSDRESHENRSREWHSN